MSNVYLVAGARPRVIPARSAGSGRGLSKRAQKQRAAASAATADGTSEVTREPCARIGGIQHQAQSETTPGQAPKSRVDHSHTRQAPAIVTRIGSTRDQR